MYLQCSQKELSLCSTTHMVTELFGGEKRQVRKYKFGLSLEEKSNLMTV